MKPSKAKNYQDKKELNTNLSTPKIENYFKSAPKMFNVKGKFKVEAKECDSKAVYIEKLKKKLQDFSSEHEIGTQEIGHEVEDVGASAVDTEIELGKSASAVDTEIELGESASAVDTEIELVGSDVVSGDVSQCTGCLERERKYKELKKLYIKLSLHCAETDLKLSDLSKTRTRTNQLEIDDGVSDDVFSSQELKFLQCMSLEKKVDSTFINQCLQYAYKDLSVLLGKTLKGKSEIMQISEEGEVKFIPGKDPLTPTKVARIRDLFIERISKCEVDAVSYGNRIKDTYLNKLIASSIVNITKKLMFSH